MEHEELNLPTAVFQRPFPTLKQVAIISLCSLILKNPADETLLEYLPDVLRKECLVMYQRMRNNLLHLQRNQSQFNNKVLKSVHNVAWTPFGTIDMVETFHRNKQRILPKQRFKLACYLCLEDELRKIWNKKQLTNVCNEPWKLTDVFVDERILAYWMKICRDVPPGPGEIFDIFKVCVEAYYLLVPSKFYPLAHFWDKLTPAERQEGLEHFIHTRVNCFEGIVAETADVTVFLLNKMNDAQKGYFITNQSVPFLVSLSQFYYLSEFLQIFRFLLVRKCITVPNAFKACLTFYNLLSRDCNVVDQKPLDFPVERDQFFRASVVLVLQDTSCCRIDLIKTYQLLAEYYDRRLVEVFEHVDLAQIEIMNNVVDRIVSGFGPYIDGLEAAHRNALENRTCEAYRAFIRQFVLSYAEFSVF